MPEKYGPLGTGFDDEAERLRRPHAERLAGGEHHRPDVERAARLFGNPLPIQATSARVPSMKIEAGNLRHRHALAGPVHARVIGVRAEQRGAATVSAGRP